MQPSDLSMGAQFGRWIVTGIPYRDSKGRLRVAALCSCGTRGEVYAHSIGRGHSKSCGCLRSDNAVALKTSHGDSGSNLHNVWKAFRNRCSNPNAAAYPNYGGRGISYDPAWDDYVTFRDWALANGYEKGLELDRIDNDGNYEPSNCRWTTRSVQVRNTRAVRLITMAGETKTMIEWSEDPRCLVQYKTLHARLDRGWEIERAMITPTRVTSRICR